MAIFTIIMRKMLNNKWLEISMLIGMVIAVALVSSMPMFKYAMINHMLLKDLENVQQTTQEYPGKYQAYGDFTGISPQNIKPLLDQSDHWMQTTVQNSFGMKSTDFVRLRRTDSYKLKPVTIRSDPANIDRQANIGTMTELYEKAHLIQGKLPSKTIEKGDYEALITENAASYLKVSVGDIYQIDDPTIKENIRVKIVGIISKKDKRDLYWYDGSLADYQNTFFIDESLFQKNFVERQVLPIKTAIWYFVLDYSKVSLSDVQKYLNTDAAVNQYLKSQFQSFGTNAPAYSVLNGYYDKTRSLSSMLWSLNVPVLLMLVFYLYMVSNLSVERQRTEISVLRSRGASRMQIIGLFLVEHLVLSVIALLIGPLVGKVFTGMLGASSGFLEFVQGESLQVEITTECYIYALYAILFTILLTLIPVVRATKVSIVKHKQKSSRLQQVTFWHKYYIDVLLLSISLYELYSYQIQIKSLSQHGMDPSAISIDPLLLMMPTLFIVGAGFFILRIYPMFVRLVYWLGKNWWSPSMYSTLIQVGRSNAQYHFLMVFLVITIATGLFDASAARTLNQNMENQINYKNGADIILSPKWENGKEPDYYTFQQLPGVEHTAKVFTKDGVNVETRNGKTQAELLGIDTYDFGHTAWFRDDMLDYPLGEYLDLIARNPYAVIVSTGIAQKYNVKPGDSIQIGWDGVEAKPFQVYAVIKYFPSVEMQDNNNMTADPTFVIAHLRTIQQSLSFEPYNIWIKLKSENSRTELYNAITTKKIEITGLTDTVDSLIQSRNDPLRLAINGGLTLSFLISVSITFIGFLIYWVLTLKGRILQYGVLRAIGISFVSLIKMIIAEQILVSGMSLVIGTIIGKVVCMFYVSLLQISFKQTLPIPPFEVFSNISDTIKLCSVISFMIIIGLVILGYIMSRMKIHQVVRLGED